MHKKPCFRLHNTKDNKNQQQNEIMDGSKQSLNQMVWMQGFYQMTRAESRFDTKREKTENWDDNETQLTI